MRVSTLLRLLAAFFALSLVAAACGDDDAPDTDAGADSSDADHSDADHEGDHDDTSDMSDGDMGDMSDSDMSDMNSHDHSETVEFEGADVPTIEIDVVPDPAGGANIHVTTTNYQIAPEHASGEYVEGEGHFHLFVDGERQLRFYNESIYFAGLVEGDAEVMVELSANDHRPYTANGEPLNDTVTVAIPEHTHDDDHHGDVESVEFEGAAPEIAVEVVADAKSGYNAFITLDGMTLSPEHVNGDNVAGEGHLHILVNGDKLGRLYGLATHIPVLPDGDVEITVAAFANDHSPYVIDGEPVAGSTTITVAS